jgi:hypothetical protein
MFALQKIKGHIKKQELQELRLTRFIELENARAVPNPERIKDLQRVLSRIQENIKMWKDKLSSLEL